MGTPGCCPTPYPAGPAMEYPGCGPQYPVGPGMGYPGCGSQYPVSPAMEYPGCGPQYPAGQAMGYPDYGPQYPLDSGMGYAGYGPQYPVSPAMGYAGYSPQYPVSPAMGYAGYGPQYPVSPAMGYAGYGPQYPASPAMGYAGYGPQYPMGPGMGYAGYSPQYPASPAMEYPGYGPQYPGIPVGGEEDITPPMPAGTPYSPAQSLYGPVAGAEALPPADAPLVPNPWPAPVPAIPAEYPPMPPVPWTPPGPVAANIANTSCDWTPETTATPAQSPTLPPVEPFQTEPAADFVETGYMPAAPDGVETLPSMPEVSAETVEVEAGEALPGDSESVDSEESSEPFTPGVVLGTIEGSVSVKVGNRPVRPLTNQLVLICNRATGERFQAYTDNQGYYSRRVPEGAYIVQIRQRIAAPFVRQRLARVQELRRTINDINVVCAENPPKILRGES